MVLEPLRVVVTGAAGQIAYSLLHPIANGSIFGCDQPVTLLLLDIPPMMTSLGGVEMELQDCSFPLLSGVVITADVAEAFKDADAVFLVGAMPRREGMERKDLLTANANIFKVQGKAIDQYAKKTVKVLVVGNPANTNALICSKYAPSIPKENFSAMTRLDQNRATAQIALRLKLSPADVKNVIIWGNHSSTQFPDVSHATANVGGTETDVESAIADENYLRDEFVKTIQTRGAAVIKARKLSSAMSAAKAAGDHMRDWFHGTSEGRYVSMAVFSDGSYGTPEGIMFSFPVEIDSAGKWKIVQNLSISEFARSKLDLTAKELLEEAQDALEVCKD